DNCPDDDQEQYPSLALSHYTGRCSWCLWTSRSCDSTSTGITEANCTEVLFSQSATTRTMRQSSSVKKHSVGQAGFPSRTALPPSRLVQRPFAVPPRKNCPPSVSPALTPPQPHTV
ncbi:hypothetical protein PMAYCL1PPCAC_04182, partial [Pristionchus mayeri]